jgi:hypothetical protein
VPIADSCGGFSQTVVQSSTFANAPPQSLPIRNIRACRFYDVPDTSRSTLKDDIELHSFAPNDFECVSALTAEASGSEHNPVDPKQILRRNSIVLLKTVGAIAILFFVA